MRRQAQLPTDSTAQEWLLLFGFNVCQRCNSYMKDVSHKDSGQGAENSQRHAMRTRSYMPSPIPNSPRHEAAECSLFTFFLTVPILVKPKYINDSIFRLSKDYSQILKVSKTRLTVRTTFGNALRPNQKALNRSKKYHTGTKLSNTLLY